MKKNLWIYIKKDFSFIPTFICFIGFLLYIIDSFFHPQEDYKFSFALGLISVNLIFNLYFLLNKYIILRNKFNILAFYSVIAVLVIALLLAPNFKGNTQQVFLLFFMLNTFFNMLVFIASLCFFSGKYFAEIREFITTKTNSFNDFIFVDGFEDHNVYSEFEKIEIRVNGVFFNGKLLEHKIINDYTISQNKVFSDLTIDDFTLIHMINI